MSSHEVPKNHNALNVSVVEGIVMSPVPITVNNFFTKITSIPPLTVESMNTIHMGGIVGAFKIAVHMVQDVIEMPHLDVVEPSIIGNNSIILTLTEVGVKLWRVGDGMVLETMEVD